MRYRMRATRGHGRNHGSCPSSLQPGVFLVPPEHIAKEAASSVWRSMAGVNRDREKIYAKHWAISH